MRFLPLTGMPSLYVSGDGVEMVKAFDPGYFPGGDRLEFRTNKLPVCKRLHPRDYFPVYLPLPMLAFRCVVRWHYPVPKPTALLLIALKNPTSVSVGNLISASWR